MSDISHLTNTERVPGAVMTRRNAVQIAGVTLIATSLLGTTGCASALNSVAAPVFPRIDTGPISAQTVAGVPIGALNGGTKPIFVAPPGSMDPIAHSVADTLFWGEQLMEHAMFIAMLMPGPELIGPRTEAEQLQRQFANHLARLRGSRLDRSNYVAFNNSTLGLSNSIIEYKRRMEVAQTAGRIRSLVWPMFFAHVRHEAERFARRLDQLNRGSAAFDRREVVPFWADKMEEHSLFVAHLLDPSEQALIGAARTSAGLFGKLERTPPVNKGPAMAAAQQIIDFKVAAEKGIQAGQIKSIINPALADHVRREAIRFKDELKRSV
ncbi:MAG TPA: DUF2935 domain-containing protein [Sphingomicrobium sp.]|nr:DUF2935 domain-containing protein [Sphingomicrobium sp.]